MTTLTHRPRIFAAAALVAVAGAWSPLLQAALVNAGEFVLPVSAHAGLIAGTGLALFAVAAAVPLWAGHKRREPALAAVMAAGFLLWFETTIVAGRYGPLTGAAPDWAAHRPLAWAEAAALAAAIAAVVVPAVRARLVRNAVTVAVVLIISSLANIIPALRTQQAATSRPTEYVFTDAGLFDLSPERNVVIVVLDSFQSDVFAGIAAADSHWSAALDGFTYFPDAVAPFPRTNGSIPALLTGRPYDNSRPYPRYVQEVYRDGGVLRTLKRRGHDVRIHSFTSAPYLAHPLVADNLARADDRIATTNARRREQAMLLDLLLLKLAPTPARPWVYNNNRFRIGARLDRVEAPDDPYPLDEATRVLSAGNGFADLEFADRARAHLNLGSEAPTVRVYHLGSPHAPFHLDADLAYEAERPYTPTSYRAQATAALRILEVLLERMQALGVYDDSLILVLADHGDGDMPALGIDAQALKALAWTGDVPVIDATDDHALVQGGLPLVLVKAPGARGPLGLSITPVTLEDVTATVLDALNLPPDEGATGRSMLAPPPAEPRRRLHRHYPFSGRGHPDYLLPMTEYAVEGFAWDPHSWSPTGRNLNQAAGAGAGMIVLGAGGNFDGASSRGWSEPAERGRFIADKDASLTLPPPSAAESVALRVTMSHEPPQPPSTLVVSVNGEDIAAWTVGGLSPEDYLAFIPDRFLAGGEPLVVGFRLAADAEPGPQVVEVHLDTERRRPALPLSERVAMGDADAGAALLGDGWAAPEPWGAWTVGALATMACTVQPAPSGETILDCEIMPAAWGDAPPVEVTVRINGRDLGTVALAKGDARLVLPVPAGTIGANGHADIELRVKNPRSPREYLGGTDGRLLGVGLKSVTLDVR